MSDPTLEIVPRSNGRVPPAAPLGGRTSGSRFGVERGVPLLDEDRALAAAAPAELASALGQLLRIDVVKAEPGPWDPESVPIRPDAAMGLLLLEGFVTRRQELDDRSSAELLGPGDLLRPWDWDGGDSVCVATSVSWQVCEATRVALLDQRAAAVIGRSPALTAELMSRLVRRSRLLATLLALTHIRQLKERVRLVLWSLAERWGRVTPDGVALAMPLTHATIAQLAGASRPSVTSAVAELQAEGAVSRLDNHGWLLTGEPPAGLDSSGLDEAAADRVAG